MQALTWRSVVCRGLVGFLSALGPALALGATDSAGVRALFANPPREYATVPLWVWNDLLTEQQIRDTMRDLAGQKVMQVFVHPRPGLMTPYLSDDWFRLWKVALEEASRLDMNVWIYDENSYPSGFAGGWVPELMPESRGLGLALRESQTAPRWNTNLVAVYGLQGERVENLTSRIRSGETLPDARYLVAGIQRAGNSPWHGNRSYVNLLTPGVTEKFIEVTLEAYRREVGDQFGKRIPGVFTDEPNIRPAGGFPWCPDLPEQFRKRWGYDLLEHLPSLTLELGDWRRIRHNYFCLLNELFIERWGKPMYEWCDRHGLDFTGHYWDHEWPHCLGVPDNMAMAAWQHRPGIDTLMNQYAENTHAQFGNVRVCREISSIANQLGRRRTLVELYGAGGWDLRFEDMKRIGDWLQVLGINTMDEHLSYITLRGARKRDHPQSFSYHEPWWEAYHVNAQYLARLSAVLSQGEQINRVLVLEPTTTAWMYQGNEAKLREIGDTFFNLLMALEAAQIEYDLGCEDVIKRWGKPAGQARAPRRDGTVPRTQLQVGARVYDRVVVPPMCENLDREVQELLNFTTADRRYGRAGLPGRRLDGAEPPSTIRIPESRVAPMDQLIAAIIEDVKPSFSESGFTLERVPADRGILFHHRRVLDDGQVLLLVNSSIEHRSQGVVRTSFKGLEQWDLYSGEAEPYPFVAQDRGCSARFDLPPSGSLLLLLTDKPARRDDWPAERTQVIAASTQLEIRRLEPNVLTLDYVDITAGGETRKDQYFYAANQFAWRKNGMPRNPWDSAVQFKDELISRTFPADSGFEASYHFVIEGPVPANLEIVIERSDLYAITCNGQPVAPETAPVAANLSRRGLSPTPPGAQTVAFKHWWLDKAFGRVPLAQAARTGENIVTLEARPFTIFHEIEPAYVRGDFTLTATDKGFIIAPDQPLTLQAVEPTLAHGNQPDGTMWLSGGIGFTPGVEDRAPFVTFDLGKPVELARIRLWNYGESNVRDLTSRGAKQVRLSAGSSPDNLEELITIELPMVSGPGRPTDLPVKRSTVARYVKLECLSNHAGVSFPAAGEPPDNGFVGLAEARFITGGATEVRGVTIHQVSSELTSFRRVAKHLVDGSGLRGARPGWNAQGHPFYAHGVAYRQRFQVGEQTGRFVVSLPDWYGSVARVDVNGQRAGYIVAPPWECEVSGQIRRGENIIEVVVFGTLRNTLGPHHGGHALGSAWPSMFQNGPSDGPPPGTQYATVGYGLFEPFLLKQVEPVVSASR